MPTKKELQEKLEQLKETNELLKTVIKRIARLECLLENNDIDPKFCQEEEDESDKFYCQ